MLQMNASSKIYFAKNSIDFRCGIESLMGYCARVLGKDPMGGAFFVYRNRTGSQLKVLHYDGVGFFLLLRRFSQGKIVWWPVERECEEMDPRELCLLLMGGNPQEALLPLYWKKI